MFQALVNGERVEAFKNGKGHCPLCGTEVIAKCGEINTWHWAHRHSDCDIWSEGETNWHKTWKEFFPSDWTEVTVKKGNEVHRADILTNKNIVIELQHSSISLPEARKREKFYKKMIWLFDGSVFKERISLYKQSTITRISEGIIPAYDKIIHINNCYKWLYPSKTILNLKRPVVLDIDGELLFLKKTFGYKYLYFLADELDIDLFSRINGTESEALHRGDEKLSIIDD